MKRRLVQAAKIEPGTLDVETRMRRGMLGTIVCFDNGASRRTANACWLELLVGDY